MKKLDVYYCGWGEHWKLGQLADNKREILFEYSAEALRRGMELSPLHLRLRSEAYGGFPSHQMNLPGLIADSLPDGWGLLLMDKLFRKNGWSVESLSPLDRLSFVGQRGLGALEFEPSTEEQLEPNEHVSLLTLAKQIKKFNLTDATDAILELAQMGGSPQGARPKVIVYYDKKMKKVASHPFLAASAWLIKYPAKQEHKEVCAIEFLYSELARAGGLEMSETTYFDLSNDLSAFGTRRFDREKGQKIHIHTLAGLLNADYRLPTIFPGTTALSRASCAAGTFKNGA